MSTTTTPARIGAHDPELKWFRIPDMAAGDSHLRSSTAMIREAAAIARPGRVALLGCGSCAEIPLGFLGTRFERVDLVDLDADALRIAALGALQFDTELHNYAFHACDLTGLKDQLERRAEEIVTEEPMPSRCLDRLSEELATARPAFWRPEDGARHHLIVCSGVLTQLQARIRESVEDIFLGRHPDGRRLLCSHTAWTRNVWRFARRIEHAFLEHLDALSSPDGIIYLADTVHVSWLRQVDPRHLISSGTWIATETSSLADYLDDNHRMLSRQKWDWIRQGQEGDFWGRLYGVQALIYRSPVPLQEK